MARKKTEEQADMPNTCQNCRYWRNKQSIFDFQTTKGICLKAPEETSVGWHHQNIKEYMESGKDKGKPSFYVFCEKPTDREIYFITRENFGCIKFEQKTLQN